MPSTVTKTGLPASVLSAKVELSGDFFRRDPAKTLQENITDMLGKLSEEMEAALKTDIASHQSQMPYWTGWTDDHIAGYTTSTKTGKHWTYWAAAGIPTTGMDRTKAIRTKAAAASIERRFHPFRRVRSAVYRLRATAANLTRGIE